VTVATDEKRSAQFRRLAELLVAVPLKGKSLNAYGADVFQVSDLDISFKVKKTLGKEPNTAEATILNLSAQTRAAFQDKNLRVTIRAGYEGALADLFVGNARDIDSAPEEADWKTTIQLGDGERGYRHGRVSASFRPGVPVTRVLQSIADGMQLDSTLVTGVDALVGRQYVAGYTAHGRAARELDKILKGFGLEWSIQDGRLLVLAPDQSTNETIVVLSADSGLVGSPTLNTPGASNSINPFTGTVVSTRGKPTLKAKCLLQPEIKPGRRVEMDSVTGIKGLFRITSVEHSGDTAGGDWYTSFEGVQV